MFDHDLLKKIQGIQIVRQPRKLVRIYLVFMCVDEAHECLWGWLICVRNIRVNTNDLL